MGRRLGLIGTRSSARRDLRKLEASQRGGYELFSLPYSEHHPERHPWIAAADVINLHRVSGFVDFQRFFHHAPRRGLVWTLHDQQPYLGGFHYERDAATNPRFAALERRCRRIKQQSLGTRRLTVVGNSAWNTGRARASGFFPGGTRFETIYYPLDSTRFAPRERSAARAVLGLPADRLVVGFASTSLENERKGLGDLLAAVAQLEVRHSNLVLLSFGRGSAATAKRALRTRWENLGFLGSDTLKSVVYSAMDVFVIPSRAEAFGQTAIEALACGTAVVGSDVGGIGEALDGGRCGVLFAPGNADSLAKAIDQLLVNTAARQRLAAAGRELVLARHSPAACAQAYRRLYIEAAGTTHGYQ
jgi:glycosyltransferase involved in cell wall biosynthesis